MKKIALLTCLKANEVCTGAACFKAFNERSRHFESYQGEDVQLVAFAKCNGCGSSLESSGLQEKLQRLISIGTEVVHLGVCTKDREGNECGHITEIARILENSGIEVVRGTH